MTNSEIASGSATPVLQTSSPMLFVGGNNLDTAPQDRVRDFVQSCGGHTVIRRVLIANNGIAAVKEIRSVRKWAYETFGDERAIEFVAMATPEDLRANAEFIRMADKYVEVPGGSNNNNYANVDVIVDIAERMNVHAVWAGWGHASENPRLPEKLAASDKRIVFIGPPGSAMRSLGDKISSTIVAQSANVPCLPWSGDGITDTITHTSGHIIVPDEAYQRATVHSAAEGLEHALRIGFPVMIKASEGGGGKGIRMVPNEDKFHHAFQQVQGEVPGSPIFIMKLAGESRHLEVQVLADQYGNAISLFGRDCSVQRRHQKIIEEAPVTIAKRDTFENMEKAAVRLAKLIGYVSAGTVEYLYSPKEDRFYFLEVNPRLQVEHPTTEIVSGVNLPAAQLQVAMGLPLHRIREIRLLYGLDPKGNSSIDFDFSTPQSLQTQRKPAPKGHVTAVRITAENPDAGFKPSGGVMHELNFRSSTNVWGYFSVSPTGGLHEFADSQFGHIFAYGQDRNQSRQNMVVALKELSIRGDFRTTVEYLITLLETPAFAQNQFNTAWLDMLISKQLTSERPDQSVAIVCGAVYKAYTASEEGRAEFKRSMERGQVPSRDLLRCAFQVDFIYEGQRFRFAATKASPESYWLFINGSRVLVSAKKLSDGGLLVLLDGISHTIYAREEVGATRLMIDGKTCLLEQENDPTQLRSPSPGKLVRYLVETGSHIRAGEAYAEIEVMKMYMPLNATEDGVVQFIRPPGSALEGGDIIGILTLDDPSRVKHARPFEGQLPPLGPPTVRGDKPHQLFREAIGVLESILDGYDNLALMQPSVDMITNILRSSPELPFLEMGQVLSSLVGRLPSGLEAALQRELDSALQGNATVTANVSDAGSVSFSRIASIVGSNGTGLALHRSNDQSPLSASSVSMSPMSPVIASASVSHGSSGNSNNNNSSSNSNSNNSILSPTASRQSIILNGSQQQLQLQPSLGPVFPAERLAAIIEEHLGALRPADAITARNNAAPLIAVVERYIGGLAQYEIDVFTGLLSRYCDVESMFNEDSRKEDEVMLALRDQFRADSDRMIGTVISHNNVALKNRLIMALLNTMRTQSQQLQSIASPAALSKAYGSILKRLADLRSKLTAQVALRARELLIQFSLPSYDERRFQMERILRNSVTEYTYGSADEYEFRTPSYDAIKELVVTNFYVFDVLQSFFHHQNPWICLAALEVYARRAYQAYDIVDFDYVTDADMPYTVFWRFTLPDDANRASPAVMRRMSGSFNTAAGGKSGSDMKRIMSVSDMDFAVDASEPFVFRRGAMTSFPSFDAMTAKFTKLLELFPTNPGATAPASPRTSAFSFSGMATPSALSSMPHPATGLMGNPIGSRGSGNSNSGSFDPVVIASAATASIAALQNNGESDQQQQSASRQRSNSVSSVHSAASSVSGIQLPSGGSVSGSTSVSRSRSSAGSKPAVMKHILNIACQAPALDSEDDQFWHNKLLAFIREHAETLRQRRIRRVTFIILRSDMTHSLFTFREPDDFSEDIAIRHVEPGLAYQLELPRLANFAIKPCASDNRNLQIYYGVSKENPTDCRFFVRVLVRPGKLKAPVQTADYLISESDRIVNEILDALEVVSAQHPNSDCNHLFINFIPSFDVDHGAFEPAFRGFIDRHGKRLWRMRVTSAELRFIVQGRGLNEPTPFRFTVDNKSGYVPKVETYMEMRSAETGEWVFKSLDYPPGPLDGQAVSTPYQPKEVLQPRRYLAHNMGTTYVYDFPELFRHAVMAAWEREHLRATSVVAHSGSSGPQRTKLRMPQQLLISTELVLDKSGKLFEVNREPGRNTIGMVAWVFQLFTPQYPSTGRKVVVIANDITHRSGTFGPAEDQLFFQASEYARAHGLPRIYLSANSGARIGVAEEVRPLLHSAWIDEADPTKGFRYLYLSPDDYANVTADAAHPSVVAQRIVVLDDGTELEGQDAPSAGQLPAGAEERYVLSAVIGASTQGLGVECLRGSGLIAGATSRAYDEIFTISLVTCRSVGIGAYLVRLGQRSIQNEGQPIILTGAPALNKVLGREVYTSNLQMGGTQIMFRNGVSHLTAENDMHSIQHIIDWLAFVPEYKDAPALLFSTGDHWDRDVEFEPPKGVYDPRWFLAGRSEVDPTTGEELSFSSGFFDRDSFVETLGGWARTVVVGRARLGGLAMGVIAVETRSTETVVPADPANSNSEEQVLAEAGQVWYPNSSFKTAQAINDFNKGEQLPLMIFANWRGFSGGQRDMFNEVLKYGSYIVDALTQYEQPIFIYIIPNGELRGGAWVVLDPTINADQMEMYADNKARGGVLEPEGIVEIKFKRPQILATMERLDDTYRQLKQDLAKAQTAEERADINAKVVAREKLLLPVYTQIAVQFADLHDRAGRMKAKGVIRMALDWRNSRRFFFWRALRRVREEHAIRAISKVDATPAPSVAQQQEQQYPSTALTQTAAKSQQRARYFAHLRRWFAEDTNGAHDWDTSDRAVAEWFEAASQHLSARIAGLGRESVSRHVRELAASDNGAKRDAVIDGLVGVFESLSSEQRHALLARLSESTPILVNDALPADAEESALGDSISAVDNGSNIN
ncbi:hypothetical protein GQ42DRAFT_160031 [Ramicandelaber brevisporus]|nr:hypothetical protein GQ42DRAFT_160031 [Ramicandelaber brevisporus]